MTWGRSAPHWQAGLSGPGCDLGTKSATGDHIAGEQ